MKSDAPPLKELAINKKKIINVFFLISTLTAILMIIFSSIYVIGVGQRGVLLTFGKPSMDAKGEGIHIKFPFPIQTIVKLDVKTLKYEADLTAASKDLQDVSTKIAINYRLSPDRVPNIVQTIGTNYAEVVIYPLEQETNKGITAQYTAEELITKRDEVREKMRTNLLEKLQSRGIIVEEVSIVNFAFSPSFTQAIEAKVTAEQNALAAKNKLEQVKYEAEQRLTQANAEATAIKIQAEAITQQGGKEYVQLQAINKWDGKMPQMTGVGGIPFINVQSPMTTA
jgi:regulator of protease activity HflC (stomatin/prohibitin superfamily)